MPKFTDYTEKSLAGTLTDIRRRIYTVVAKLAISAWRTPEPVPYRLRRSGRRMRLAEGDVWGGLFDCAWFRFTGRVPASAAGRKAVLLLDVNGEMCVVDSRGNPVQGMTNGPSFAAARTGWEGKRVLDFARRARGGEPVDVWADAGCNGLFGSVVNGGRVAEASIAVCRDDIRALYYDYEVLHDLLQALPKDTAQRRQVAEALHRVSHLLSTFDPAEVAQARRILSALLRRRGGDPFLTVSAVGHAHLDLMWMWPERETIRKGARTFATALRLADRYPGYVFGASQARLFLWMKERYPALYARIREAARRGRIEPQGAMWVEPDTNVPCGESLVRQILEGKRFFRAEFGIDPDYVWLPDSFGYTAALPQIMAGAGIRYFMTQKMSWNLVNTFPHHSFLWRGPDGSGVLAHMLPENDYNSSAGPAALRKIEANYAEKDVSGHALMLFGIGDGGGGPGEEHLERLARLRNMPGLCPVRQEPAARFFRGWAADAARFPTWVGEMYLERHQGTLTTQARSKWYNRRMETALRELEWAAAVNRALFGAAYPSADLRRVWRDVLLFQFHDILPGSSIKRVYDETHARYETMLREVSARIAACDRVLARGLDTSGMRRPVVARNSLSWPRTEWAKLGRAWRRVEVPPMGCAAVDAAAPADAFPAVSAREDRIENDLLRVRFDRRGLIASVFDKRAGRELVPAGERANRLTVYADRGDAWDIPLDYARRRPAVPRLVSCSARVDGPRAAVRQVRRIGHSEIVQDISLTAGSRLIEFDTRLRWRETASMLRALFPVNVRADEASYEIQFGRVRRPTHGNTAWDLAMDEVPAQRWADLSQPDYGVALLNDSKHAYRIKDGVMELNLLRSAPYSGPRLVRDEDVRPGEPHHAYSDQCDHAFRYALYPHPGDAAAAGVVRAGCEFNTPLRLAPAASRKGPCPARHSLLEVDAPNVVISWAKKPENGDGLAVRLYETEGAGANAVLRVGIPVRAAAATNLIEERAERIRVSGGGRALRLRFRPFEIKTIRLSFRAGRAAGEILP